MNRMIVQSLLAPVIAFMPLQAACAQAPNPVVVTAEQAKGSIFSSPKAVTRKRDNGGQTQWFEMLKSADKSSAGIFAATASDINFEAYPHDEFMYFLEGGVTLTSADGSVVTVKTGDGLVIAKGWKGKWKTDGYRKFYVTYNEK